MDTLFLLILAVILIILHQIVTLILNRQKFFKKIANIPGPKSIPLIGNALEFKKPEDLLINLMKYYKQYGSTFKLQLGSESLVFTADPDMIEFITSSNAHVKKGIMYKFVKNWLGNGLLVASNPRWKNHRKLITPAFHFNILKDFIPTFHKHADNLIDCWIGETRTTGKKEKDIQPDILACALDTICETAMGISINALRDGVRSKYMECVKNLGRTIMERTFSFWKQFDILYKLSDSYRHEVESLKILRNTTEEVIKQKRKDIEQNKKSNGSDSSIQCETDEFGRKRRIAFLDLLLATTNENGGSFTDTELREEVDTFVFAGHETTAHAIAYVLYFLAKNQDAQEKVYTELIQVLEGETHISYEKLANLKYLEMVIKESLRILPIGPIFMRRLTEDVTYNGFMLPKGINICIFAYAAHRNEDIYDDPEKFDPERFAIENCIKRHPFAYVPFSAGLRNCIGQRFAILEMKCILSSLLKTFKFSKSPNVEIKLCAEGILKSSNGVQLIIQPRNELL